MIKIFLAMNLIKSYILALLFFGILTTSVEAQIFVGISSNTVQGQYRSSTDTNVGYGYEAFDAAGGVANSNLTSGLNNSAFGENAGRSLTEGSNNVLLGYSAATSSATGSNQIVIGSSATGQADNSVVLGNASVTAVYMAQDGDAVVYAGGIGPDTDTDLVTFANDAITINGDLTLASDARLKSNILSLGATLSKLLKIDGKRYTFKESGKESVGVLAQEIQEVFPELVKTNKEGLLSVNYQGLIPVLINAVKEQQQTLETVQKEKADLEARIQKLEAVILNQ